MNRKKFIKYSGMTGLLTATVPLFAGKVLSDDQITSKAKAIIDDVMSKPPDFWNTDWDGTMLMEALLLLKDYPGTLEYVKKWFDYHIENDNKLTDKEIYATFSGPNECRIIRGKYLPFTMYSGFFGLPFPCFEFYKQTGDDRAKQICLDVANAILHKAARNNHGLVLHDDGLSSRNHSKIF
ncbi:MAG: hypothetical protein R3182_09590, partial [Draconibacterium sp.]|nr:hypothetical protein [Draconibacterium sp.]